MGYDIDVADPCGDKEDKNIVQSPGGFPILVLVPNQRNVREIPQ